MYCQDREDLIFVPKKRERSETEYLRGQLREAEKLNRQLRKRLKQLEDQKHFYPSQDEEVSTTTEDTKPKNIRPAIRTCPKCSEGKLREFELIGRTYEECDECEYRKKISNG